MGFGSWVGTHCWIPFEANSLSVLTYLSQPISITWHYHRGSPQPQCHIQSSSSTTGAHPPQSLELFLLLLDHLRQQPTNRSILKLSIAAKVLHYWLFITGKSPHDNMVTSSTECPGRRHGLTRRLTRVHIQLCDVYTATTRIHSSGDLMTSPAQGQMICSTHKLQY